MNIRRLKTISNGIMQIIISILYLTKMPYFNDLDYIYKLL